jgi:hypothetical protein
LHAIHCDDNIKLETTGIVKQSFLFQWFSAAWHTFLESADILGEIQL